MVAVDLRLCDELADSISDPFEPPTLYLPHLLEYVLSMGLPAGQGTSLSHENVTYSVNPRNFIDK